MKETLLLTLLTLLLHTTSGDRFNALKFGQTQYDYILFQPNMQPFETGFTTCAWIRKLYRGLQATWFSYATNVTTYEIEIGDNGYETFLFGGSSSDLRSLYTVTPGNWFHNCMSWDATSNSRNVYINGALVDSKATPAGRTLTQGGSLVLGNEQDSGPGEGMDSSDIFGGELFKLNMFSKKLSDAEIKEMARDMCSVVEETHGEVRAIKWEDVLLTTRTGNITEIESGCISPIALRKLRETEEKLNNTIADLEKKSQQLNTTETEKQRTIEKLDTVTQELDSTTTALNQTQVELEQVKDLLEKAKDCPLNTTITSYWDFLYSTEFYGAVITSRKLEVLTKNIEKLEYFEGTRITDGIIQFFKMFHDGEDHECLS